MEALPTAFERDDGKAALNAAKHIVTFPFATRVFLDRYHVVIAVARPEPGEDRFKAFGRIDGKLYVVVFTMRGEIFCRLIPARRANAKEAPIYGPV